MRNLLIGNCYFTILDPNANPNKRQRQPALLGDHPPDYGKYPIDVYKERITFQYCICALNMFSLIKVALKEVIMATVKTTTGPLLPTAWGQVWVGVAGVASATALDMDPLPLSTGLTLTHQF